MAKERRLKISFHRGVIFLSLAILMILHFGLAAPWWVLALFCVWIPLYYMGFPYYRKRRWEEFERLFAQRFQRGEHKALLEDYRKARFLRRFGPQAEMLSRLGLIYSALEKYREAEHALERAIDSCEGRVPEQTYFNLANVKFELGKFDDAMKIYLTLRGNSPYQRAARTQMALIDLDRGARVDQAMSFLKGEREKVSENMRERIDRALVRHRA